MLGGILSMCKNIGGGQRKASKEGGLRLFSVVHSGRTRSNRHKLEFQDIPFKNQNKKKKNRVCVKWPVHP